MAVLPVGRFPSRSRGCRPGEVKDPARDAVPGRLMVALGEYVPVARRWPDAREAGATDRGDDEEAVGADLIPPDEDRSAGRETAGARLVDLEPTVALGPEAGRVPDDSPPGEMERGEPPRLMEPDARLPEVGRLTERDKELSEDLSSERWNERTWVRAPPREFPALRRPPRLIVGRTSGCREARLILPRPEAC